MNTSQGEYSFQQGETSETRPRTLYVGNLDGSMTEELLRSLFGGFGAIKGCTIIHESKADHPYAFIEFALHSVAYAALVFMNRRQCQGKELRVNWATPGLQPGHYNIFVGDLAHEVDSQTLQTAFSQWGQISECRVVRDPISLKSKCYGFISFFKKSDAELAMDQMQGAWIGNRAIRTNWARGKQGFPKGEDNNDGQVKEWTQTYDEIYYQVSSTNSTVYCGGISEGLTEELVKKIFSPFGKIKELRVMHGKGYAFIRFEKKESAARAIFRTNRTVINEQLVRCSWGKDIHDQVTPPPPPPQQQYVPTAPNTPYYYPSFDFFGQQGYFSGQHYYGTPFANSILQHQFHQAMQGNFGYQAFNIPGFQYTHIGAAGGSNTSSLTLQAQEWRNRAAERDQWKMPESFPGETTKYSSLARMAQEWRNRREITYPLSG